MVPRGFGEMPDRVDHHQRALPAMRAVPSPDPAALQVPVRQLALEPRFDFLVAVGAFLALFVHPAGLPSMSILKTVRVANAGSPSLNPYRPCERPAARKSSERRV